ncbi:MAG: PAS domain-containing sensor histidine kinase [Syntrophobacteraceae bacterium]|nr:PAS domain-containing sensor histidine kinase [Syntrophobacteraceae bacterium]
MGRQLATPAAAMNTVIANRKASGVTMALDLAFDSSPATDYAPAKTTSAVELEKQLRYFNTLTHVKDMLDAVSTMVAVVNDTRQILFCNRKVVDFLGVADTSKLTGRRLGEAFSCVRLKDAPNGCGTGEYCKTCGAVNGMLMAIGGEENVQECNLMRYSAGVVETMELSVHATPLDLEIPRLVMLSLTDISHERRRRNLEKIFFHDILNAMNGVVGYAYLLKEDCAGQAPPLVDKLNIAIDRVVGEINVQRELLAAENNELKVYRCFLGARDFLHDIITTNSTLEVACERKIVLSPDSENIPIETDPAILGRVIGNMVKNGLEACKPGEIVTLDCKRVDDLVRFSVHNPNFMPRNVQLQVFSRSFSTKGCDRGLGAYSMKLLSERYLKGSVGFESDPDSGTVFFALYPLRLSG